MSVADANKIKVPNNLEAERGVLSALLQDDVDPIPALAMLKPQDFFDSLHRRLYAKFRAMLEDGETLNIVTISDSMKLDNMEAARLAGLLDPLLLIRKPGELASLVRIVKQKSWARALQKACYEVAHANGEVSELIPGLQQYLDRYVAMSHGDMEVTEKLRVHDAEDFLGMDFPEGEALMVVGEAGTPLFTSDSLNQIFAWRGTGKTMVALGLGLAMARGSEFLKWRAIRKARVLYIEGESRNSQIQKRMRSILANNCLERGYFRIVTYSSQAMDMLPLNTPEGRAAIDAILGDAEVLILDSVSTLGNFPTNDEENWLSFLQWLKALRKRGLCVILLHHAGKSGMQRGHSRSEDMLDVSIKLTRRPEDEEADWLKCLLEFDKVRAERKGIRSLVIEFREGQWFFDMLEVERLNLLRSYLKKNPNHGDRTIAHALPELGSRSSVLRLRRQLEMEGA